MSYKHAGTHIHTQVGEAAAVQCQNVCGKMGGFDVENKALAHEGWDDLRQKKRSSTDCLFFIAIIACWGAMTLLGFVAIGIIKDDHLPQGNPARLINAVDYRGRVCGVSSDVKDKPYGYYLLDQTAVCVETCPSEADYTKFICQDEYQGTYLLIYLPLIINLLISTFKMLLMHLPHKASSSWVKINACMK